MIEATLMYSIHKKPIVAAVVIQVSVTKGNVSATSQMI